jgi:tripartite-type tricarboxylate transporter receptor subunit TctC
MLIQQTGANIVQVPYKGGTPSTIALLSGEVDFVFSTMTTVVPYLQSRRLRGLAVSTKKRSSIFPEMPTMDSIYPGFESDNWFGMFAPAGTPKEIISRLHASATEAMKSAEFRNLIAQAGGDVAGGTPEELGLHLQSEIARYSTVIKTGNIQVQ